MRGIRTILPIIGATIGLAVACGSSGFDLQTKLTTVRTLAVQIDNPYPRPGDTVTLEVLAFDGREQKPSPMGLYWFPRACINPRGDLYYRCFEDLLGAGGGTTSTPSGGGGPTIPPEGIDITGFLKEGSTFRFTIPEDIIDTHEPVAGQSPYGFAVAFNIACAGRVKVVPISSDNPQTLPLGCFGVDNRRLSWEDYVFGLTRIYSFESQTSTNPIIESLTVRGVDIPASKTFTSTPSDVSGTGATSRPDDDFGIIVERCDGRDSCAGAKLGVRLDPRSQESYVEYSGDTRNEQVWASYYSTLGEFDSDARLLYAVSSGLVGDSDNEFFGVHKAPGDGVLWVVVRDNRGGVSWRGTRIRVR